VQQFATTPLTVHEVWSKAFQLTCERWRSLYLLFVINQLIILLSVYLFVDPNKTMIDALRDQPVNTVLYFIITGLITLFIYAVAYHQLGAYLQAKPLHFKDSMRMMLKKIPTLILAGILALLLTVLGFAALIIPGVFIVGALFYYYPSLIVDNMSPAAALKYTLEIMWGQWWRSSYILMTPIFMAGVISSLFTLLILFLTMMIPAVNYISNYLTNIINILFQSYVNILLVAIQLIQWNNLKILKATNASRSAL